MNRKLSSLMVLVITVSVAYGQDFNTAMTTARTNYSAGKLEEAHFALLQAMQEVDLVIGKEVLKLLPSEMAEMTANTKDDQVTANAGYLGTTIHRSWGTTRQSELSIMGHSPLIASINLFLNTPMLGGMMADANTKLIRVKGYKGQLVKEQGTPDGQLNYTINIPLGNSLFTFKVNQTTDTEIMKLADTLPLEQVAKLVN